MISVTIESNDAEELERHLSALARRRDPRFIIFASYGNDSVALVQWAKEEKLGGVTVVYSDTGWSAPWWRDRVARVEEWVQVLGFQTSRTESIGFLELARRKRGFPTQQFQWCSYVLKIEPAIRWLEENDPACAAVCVVGVRREESQKRANFPAFLARSENHGGRVLLMPFADYNMAARDALLRRAGFEVLPHRSMECFPCVNSNRSDLRLLAQDPARIREVEAAEREIGRPLFRPSRYKGATGIHEVLRWAMSDRGKYEPPAEEEENLGGCNTGFCEK